MYLKSFTVLVLSSLSHLAFAAQDITGLWQSYDDLTGSPKGQVEISKEADGTYSGKIVKITPRPGYKPQDFCVNCPAPYTDKPILGLNVISKLSYKKETNYTGGKILDPNSGKIYSLSAKLNESGQRLTLRGYIGVSALGRSQVWMRVN